MRIMEDEKGEGLDRLEQNIDQKRREKGMIGRRGLGGTGMIDGKGREGEEGEEYWKRRRRRREDRLEYEEGKKGRLGGEGRGILEEEDRR